MIVRLVSLWLLALLNPDVLPASASEDVGHGDLPSTRIVGGSFVPVGEYPWFTMLRTLKGNTDEQFDCGGMLVSPEYVLTAAHCITSKMRNKGAVRIGAYDSPYKSGNNGGQDVEFFKLADVVTHPQYNKATENNDFALLRLDGTAKTKPVAMDSSGISNTFSTGK
jgi:secreted trypsin-like serine protease